MNTLFFRWRNKLTLLWLALLTLAAAWLGALWLNKQLHIQTNLFALLPAVEQATQLQTAQQQLAQHIDNKIFIALEAERADTVSAASAWLTAAAKDSTLWQLPTTDAAASLAQAFYQQRSGLLSAADRQALQQQQYPALLERSLLQIMSPGFPISEQLLRDDPLLLFPRYIMTLGEQLDGNLRMENGLPTTSHQGKTLQLLVLELTESPYRIDYQEQTQAWIAQTKQQLAARDINSYWTGTLVYATFGTQSAQQEISTIGAGSSLGLVLLIWFGFRSLRPLATEFIAVSSGSLIALLCTHTLFGEIHLMTLLFGASLIGVSVDFSFYFMAMQSHQRERNGFIVLQPLLPSLFVGLLTTLVAYVFLSATPFPAFQQIAVFSVAGLSGAWLTSILLLPRLPPLNAEPAIAQLAFISRWRAYFQAGAYRPYGLMLALLLTASVCLPQLQSNDDIRSLQSIEPSLQRDDHYIQQVFGHQQAANYLLISADSPAALQALEQRLIAQLDQLIEQAQLQSYQALGSWLPSDQVRAENIALLQQLPTSWLAQYAAAMQLPLADVLAWQTALQAPASTADSLLSQHPLGFLQISPTSRVIALQGIAQPMALQALTSAQVQLVQPVLQLSQAFGQQQQQAQQLLIAAMICLAVGLGLLYGARSICPLLAPVTLALLCTFALLALCKVEINLFNIMATFLVLGIGVDYAIFYRHGHQHSQVVSMALLLCMFSTLLGFGLLALSNTYAVFSFGITVLLGVFFSYVFASLITAADPHYSQL